MKKSCNIICITGPTASGKTSLAVEIALKYGCEIISGDSRQVFTGMDIGTGKDLGEYSTARGTVSHHLIDIVRPEEDYSLYRYLADFNAALSGIRRRGRMPLLAGGSGLYIEAALKGYLLPDAPADNELRSMLEKVPAHELETMLRSESEEIFRRTDLSSTRRIIRGIEIARYINENHLSPVSSGSVLSPLIICIMPPREILIKRIDKRLEQRMGQGMVDEVKRLTGAGVSHERLLKLGLEYRYTAMYLHGDISEYEMISKLKTEIHRFAKRQMTWFRGMERRGLEIHTITSPDPVEAERIIDSYILRP